MTNLFDHYHGVAFSENLNEQSQTCLNYAMTKRKSWNNVHKYFFKKFLTKHLCNGL